MSARFEVVRTDADQPWHARFVAANGRIVWTTEQYTRKTGAFGAIEAISEGTMTFGVDGRYRVRMHSSRVLVVRVLDERPEPFVPTIEAPFYTKYAGRDADWWHDHEYHYRNCYGDECTEATPPVGTLVAGRFGRVEFKP